MKVHKTFSIDLELLHKVDEMSRRLGVPSDESVEYFLQNGIARSLEIEAKQIKSIEQYMSEPVAEVFR